MKRTLHHTKDVKKNKESLFKIEKARRDVLFRDKNAVNYNVTGEKSYEKEYPVKRIKKVFYNAVLSHAEHIASKGDMLKDKSLDVPPVTR